MCKCMNLLGFDCQDIVEQPLNCYQSSLTCTSNGAQLTYSQCCATGEGSFQINETCYVCAGKSVHSLSPLFLSLFTFAPYSGALKRTL